VNRGPAAGAENRAALIAAAREIFAEQGVDAPLSAIAKRAGVGQGSLYRHFPTRGAIAGAAFDANVADIEQLVAEGGTLAQVLRMVEDQATSSTALIDVTMHNSGEARAVDLQQRMQTVIETVLPAGRAAGTVPQSFSADDVMLCIRLVASALTESAADERRPLVRRAWQLLGVRLPD
jgi:AcrR family transcriptional regulator